MIRGDRGGVESVNTATGTLWRAVGPWRGAEHEAVADDAIVHAEDLVSDLRTVLWLAKDATVDDPSPEERAALRRITALAELLAVGK